MQSRSSSSVTTVRRVVDRLSSSAVGSTIRMELHRERAGVTQNTRFFIQTDEHQLTRQKCQKRWRLDVCEYAARVSSLNPPPANSSLSRWWPVGVLLWGSRWTVNLRMKTQLPKKGNLGESAHTVLQGRQQGDDASIQQVPVVVETHHVAVEHPAELQAGLAVRTNDKTFTPNVVSGLQCTYRIYLSSFNAQVLRLYHLRAATTILREMWVKKNSKI